MVGDGSREEGHFIEPTVATEPRNARLRHFCHINRFRCRVDNQSAICAFYSSTWQIKVIFDVSLFSTYRYFIETVFNKVVINANKSNDYMVFHQPKMAIISQSIGEDSKRNYA